MSVSGTFAADGASGYVLVAPNNSVTYELDTAGFSGTAYFEKKKKDGSGIDIIQSYVEAGMSSLSVFYKNDSQDFQEVRLRVEGLDDGESEEVTYAVTETDNESNEIVLQEKSGKRLAYVNDQGVLVFDRTLSAAVQADSGAGAVNGATVSVAHDVGSVNQSIITLASTPVTVANTTGSSFGGVKIYDFPAGRILVLGVTADLSFDWSATDIVATGSGDFSLGTTITEDATLNGTEVDLLPLTGLLDPFVAGVGTGKGALAASAQFDGTATAVDANLNIIIDDADVDDAATADVLVSGTVTITWVNLGDY
jgi:hypothetical protein